MLQDMGSLKDILVLKELMSILDDDGGDEDVDGGEDPIEGLAPLFLMDALQKDKKPAGPAIPQELIPALADTLTNAGAPGGIGEPFAGFPGAFPVGPTNNVSPTMTQVQNVFADRGPGGNGAMVNAVQSMNPMFRVG